MSYRRIAQVVKAKGLTGEVVVSLIANLPFSMWEGLAVWIVPPENDLIRKTRVLTAQDNAGALLLTLEGVCDRTCAMALGGRYLLAREEDCGGAEELSQEADLLVGMRVVDETHGFIGHIAAIHQDAYQTQWIVEGPLGELLIPAVPAFIHSYTQDTVLMHLPEGLLELNR